MMTPEDQTTRKGSSDNPVETSGEASPKAFIVYKSQDDTRDKWVLRFCTDLRTEHSVDAMIDKYEVDFGGSIRAYMELIRAPDVEAALFVITPAFYEAAYESQVGPAYHERQLAETRRDRDDSFRVIPIYRESCAAYDMSHPDPLYIDFRDDAKYKKRLKELAESLGCKPRKPPLGRPVEEEEAVSAQAPAFADIQQDLLSPDGGVAETAADKIRQQGPEAVEAHTCALRVRLADKTAEKREVAARGLGILGAEKAVPLLIRVLGDEREDEQVRLLAVNALAHIPDERAIRPLISTLEDQNEDVSLRGAAAHAFAHLRHQDGIDPLTQILQNKQEDTTLRATAAASLGSIRQKRIVPNLINVINDTSDTASVRQAVAHALGNIGDERAVKPLIAALKDENPGVRGAAAWALGEIGDERVVDPLIEKLTDDHPGVRRRVAGALAIVGTLAIAGDYRAVKPLLCRLQDEEPHVQRVAAYALGRIEHSSAVPDLIKVLSERSREPHVRSEVADALGKIKDERAVESLLPVLQNREDDAIVRRAAAHALGMIETERAVGPLKHVMEDEGEPRPVREGAAGALEMIGTPESLAAAKKYRDSQ